MNIFAPVVPLLVFLLVWGIFYEAQDEWRRAFLSAAVTWGVLLAATTEILSLFKAISFWPILGTWGLYLVAAILCWIKIVGNPIDLIKDFKMPNIPRFEFFLLGSIVFIACVVGLIAMIAPPNTYDSMTYHMARVMHWIQDESVAYYPTHILRQLYLNPWSEFTILNFQVLAGTDRLANLVQWFSMIGSAIGVTLIAKELGANRQGQIFTAVVSMTIPMGILQGSSTQNDYVITFWLVGFIYWIFILKTKGDLWSAFATGASLGLAALTKATTYIYALPFLIWLSVSVLKAFRSKGLKLLGLVAFVFLAINLGYYIRNYDLFRNPIGLTRENLEGTSTIAEAFPNEVFSVPELTSNVVRNIAIHLGTPFDKVNRFFEQAVNQFHALIGISPNDPRTTYIGEDFQIGSISFNENTAGNLLHVILIIITILLVVVYQVRKQDTIFYFFSLVIGFLIFCLYLKWQPWNSRLQLPLFVLWSPIIALSIWSLRRKWIANTIMFLLILGILPWLFLNSTRPLLESKNIFNTAREDLYFNRRSGLEGSYEWAVRTLVNETNDQCREIGLYSNWDDREYPLWIVLQQKLGKDIRIEAVNVENVSANTYRQFPEFTPCAVIALDRLPVNNLKVNGIAYSIYQEIKTATLLLPSSK